MTRSLHAAGPARPALARSGAFASCLALAGLTLVSSGCNKDSSSPGVAPGASCSSTTGASTTDEARTALASASPGSCVVLTGASYEGLAVPEGVGLVSSGSGARPKITSTDRAVPAVSLREGSQLVGVDVEGAAGVGVVIRAVNARVLDVSVSGAKSAALGVLCDAGEEVCAAGVVALERVSLERSSYGLRVEGAHVAMKGGRSAGHSSTGLSGGMGIVGVAGAHVDLDGVAVEDNQGAGVVVDGARTRLFVKDATVARNAERGIWAQRVEGTLEAPAVRIEATQVTANGIVGVGSVAARGIIIVGGIVANTVSAPLATDLDVTEMVGDGIGLFEASTDFKLEGTSVEGNDRAAGLVNDAVAGIIIVGGIVAASESGLKFVVQGDKGAQLQLAETDITATAKPLGISAPKLELPAL